MQNKIVSIKIRKGLIEDLEGIFECHKLCFEKGDYWYKSIIQQNLKDSYVIEKIEATGEKIIVGVLLQGDITPCDSSDIFNPTNDKGEEFKTYNLHTDNIYGMTMLCIDPKYRGKGLAKKLIEIHFKSNEHKKMLCLNTRKSNPAYNLYLSMGYEHIANIKDKYFFPIEDACFMIKPFPPDE